MSGSTPVRLHGYEISRLIDYHTTRADFHFNMKDESSEENHRSRIKELEESLSYAYAVEDYDD